MKKFVDPRTGNEVILSMAFLLAYHREAFGPETHCEHTLTQLRTFTNAGGGTALHQQCMRCGVRIGQALKRTGSPPPADPSIEARYKLANEQRIEAVLIKHIDAQAAQDATQLRDYDAYILSPEWAERRRRVINRCGNLCEGCGGAPVSDVHHLTYRHFGEEFLFELVGLCRACHERIHAEA